MYSSNFPGVFQSEAVGAQLWDYHAWDTVTWRYAFQKALPGPETQAPVVNIRVCTPNCCFLEEKVVSIYLVALCVSWLHIQICKCVCVYAYVSVNVGMQTLAAFHPAWLLWHICFWQVNTHMLTPKSLSSTSSPSISLLGCFGPVFLLLNFISLICNFFFCVCTAFQSVVKVWLYETQ